MHGPAGRAGAAGQRAALGEEGSLALRPPTAAGRHSRTTCGTNITQGEGLKWSERPRCTAGVGLTATDTIASPRAEFLLGQWSKAELLLQSPVPACTRACPRHPVGEQAGPRLEHNSRSAAFPPGRSSARGCIWSFYFRVRVGYSQCPNSRKRQHQKQSPIGKTQGRASDTERTDQHLRCSPSAPQTLPTISRVPFPHNPGEFQREGSPGGS